jgi:predicted transcriptional regulator
MLEPCEVAVKSLIPGIRAYIATELTQTYKMKQKDVANLLGITQTAISKYTTGVRGQAIDLDGTEEICSMMDGIANEIFEQRISGPQLVPKFCEVCSAVRRIGLMCELCRRSDPELDIKTCNVCKSPENCTRP